MIKKETYLTLEDYIENKLPNMTKKEKRITKEQLEDFIEALSSILLNRLLKK